MRSRITLLFLEIEKRKSMKRKDQNKKKKVSFLTSLLVLAYAMSAVGCDSAEAASSDLHSRFKTDRILSCEIIPNDETENAFAGLDYAVKGLEIGLRGDESSLKILRSYVNDRSTMRSALFLTESYAEVEGDKISIGWNSNEYWAELSKSNNGYEGKVALEEDFGFNVRCVEKAPKPVREAYACAPVGEDRRFHEDGYHQAHELHVSVYNERQ